MTFVVCDLNKTVYGLVRQGGVWQTAEGTIAAMQATASVTEALRVVYTILPSGGGNAVQKNARLVFQTLDEAQAVATLLNQ